MRAPPDGRRCLSRERCYRCVAIGFSPIQRSRRLNGTLFASSGLTVLLSFLWFLVSVTMNSAELPCPPIITDQARNMSHMRYQRWPYLAMIAVSLRFQFSYHF